MSTTLTAGADKISVSVYIRGRLYLAMEVFAALADDTRLRIVEELAKGERAVGQLVARFDVTQPTISQHLKVLRNAGLVRVRRDAQRRLYSIDPKGLRVIERWLTRTLR
jgi:DNA-binding transcriptional ArsR family regulator